MTVRSTRLGSNASQGTGGTTLYTVPTGKRTIVKHITVRNNGAVARFIALAIQTGSTVKLAYRIYCTALGTNGDSVSLQVWWIMNAGDDFIAAASGDTFVVTVDGVELVL